MPSVSTAHSSPVAMIVGENPTSTHPPRDCPQVMTTKPLQQAGRKSSPTNCRNRLICDLLTPSVSMQASRRSSARCSTCGPKNSAGMSVKHRSPCSLPQHEQTLATLCRDDRASVDNAEVNEVISRFGHRASHDLPAFSILLTFKECRYLFHEEQLWRGTKRNGLPEKPDTSVPWMDVSDPLPSCVSLRQLLTWSSRDPQMSGREFTRSNLEHVAEDRCVRMLCLEKAAAIRENLDSRETFPPSIIETDRADAAARAESDVAVRHFNSLTPNVWRLRCESSCYLAASPGLPRRHGRR